MDIFKAIFASDEEDSDEEEGGGKDDEEQDDGDGEVGQTKSIMKQLKLQDTGPVDLATFKPTFIPREGKAKANGDDQRTKEKKDKKEKKKKEKKAGLVSFQLEEDREPNLGNPTREKDRPKKKRKDKEKKREEDNDAGMFVDQPAPEEVIMKAPKASDIASVVEMTTSNEAPRLPRPKGRKRAIDFLDE
jgi:G patch domain-containing protein 1